MTAAFLIRLIIPLLLVSPAMAAWDKGFNFRATSGYVTDGTNQTYVIDTDVYPTTRNGVTFGWNYSTCLSDLGGGTRDRDSGIDVRLAGMHFIANRDERCTFKVDLPAAGTYIITLGYGDAGGNAKNNYIVVKDSTTDVITLSAVTTAATPTFGDAVGSTYNAATWPGSQTTSTEVFATTTLDMIIGSGLAPDATDASIAHLFISQVASGVSNSVSTTPGSDSISTTRGTGNITTIP